MKTSALSAIGICVVIANLVAVIAVVNGAIARKQAIIDSGDTVFLELAPVDPRSLMQGDYMVLSFALNREEKVRIARGSAPTRGTMILELDGEKVATFKRFAEEKESSIDVQKNEIPLRYRKWRRGFRFGIESFFFEEGMADTYDQAKYAELRIAPDGRPVLVDLRGEKLRTLNVPH